MKLWLQFDRLPWKKCTAALFVLLMAGFGFVQAVHVHDALGRTDFARNRTVHSAWSRITESFSLLPRVAPTQISESTKVAELEIQLQSHLHETHSNIRPPPQNL